MTTKTWQNISKLENHHMLKTEFTVTLPKYPILLISPSFTIICRMHNHASLAGHGLSKTADSVKETSFGSDKRQKPSSGISVHHSFKIMQQFAAIPVKINLALHMIVKLVLYSILSDIFLMPCFH